MASKTPTKIINGTKMYWSYKEKKWKKSKYQTNSKKKKTKSRYTTVKPGVRIDNKTGQYMMRYYKPGIGYMWEYE